MKRKISIVKVIRTVLILTVILIITSRIMDITLPKIAKLGKKAKTTIIQPDSTDYYRALYENTKAKTDSIYRQKEWWRKQYKKVAGK